MTENRSMKQIGFLFLLLAFALCALPAVAAIDQHCLSLCIAGGTNSSNCMDKCTYDVEKEKSRSKAIPNPAAKNLADPHNVLEAPRPAGDEIMLPSKKQPLHKTHSKDYVCLNNCLQGGGQYDLCSKSCVRQDCPVGDPSCNNLLGNTNPVVPTPNTSINTAH
jgi:hypothetical protein